MNSYVKKHPTEPRRRQEEAAVTEEAKELPIMQHIICPPISSEPKLQNAKQ
jgi:hypothetical protein